MPVRKIPIITGEYYHVFNRGIDKRPVFTDTREYKRAMLTLNFYRFSFLPTRLSRFLVLSLEYRLKIIESLVKSEEKLVDILVFCLMPNHYHFLLRQLVDRGISKFLSQFENSYTRYFNTKNEREGPIFLDQFKAVRIVDDNQLLHVSRYIHLNPYTSFVLKDSSELVSYEWSSLKEYVLGTEDGICNKRTILSFYKDKDKYLKFVLNQADYQRELDKIKHLLLEK